ncbi:hypothetical protein DFH09DRAFT_1099090 [Mycena vulgaris]|nr:hypothetical protein DFH09DRAFT_1099090 [Mycena vulgaris]
MKPALLTSHPSPNPWIDLGRLDQADTLSRDSTALPDRRQLNVSFYLSPPYFANPMAQSYGVWSNIPRLKWTRYTSACPVSACRVSASPGSLTGLRPFTYKPLTSHSLSHSLNWHVLFSPAHVKLENSSKSSRRRWFQQPATSNRLNEITITLPNAYPWGIGRPSL